MSIYASTFFEGLFPTTATISRGNDGTKTQSWKLQIISAFLFSLSLLLCAWTHPKYHLSRIASLLRTPLGALTSIWWFFYPLISLVTPTDKNVPRNFGKFVFCYILMTKSLDWAFFSGPQYRRRYIMIKEVSKWQWEPTGPKAHDELTMSGLAGWIFMQLTSLRGLQYKWGHFSELNNSTARSDLLRLLCCHLYSVAILSVLLYLRDFHSGSLAKALLSCGVPTFQGSAVLARGIHTIGIMSSIMAGIEAANLTLAVVAHLFHQFLCSLRVPEAIGETLNPKYYPPLFTNVLKLNSLAFFWGKSWHQTFRRAFIVSGAFPVAGLAKTLGAEGKVQKLAGLVGAFIASGILHAYPLFLMSDPLALDGKVPLSEKLSVFCCFLLQAMGILLESFLIPLIPKNLGGEKLWTLGFLLLTLPLVTKSVCKPGRLLDLFKPLDEWTWQQLLVPVVYAPLFL